MPIRSTILFVFLLAAPAPAAPDDPCAAASSVSDVRFMLALKDGRTVFQEGEIVPLVLSFTSTAKKRYWADIRTYDRSGRLGIERYCVEPEAPDPLESYFRTRGFIGGGLGGIQELGSVPFNAEAELNEWRRLAPGRYRVYAISYRVWRPPDAGERTPHGLIPEVLRSNAVAFEVQTAAPEWQAEQLRVAVQTLSESQSRESAISAARVLRFLNTRDAARELARLFRGGNEQPGGWDLMLGLYGSPHTTLAIESMQKEIASPGHPITSRFLDTLVSLQVAADAEWNAPPGDDAPPEAAGRFWERRRAYEREVMKLEIDKVIAALPHKTGSARALTLNALLASGVLDDAATGTIRLALISAWAALPVDTQLLLLESGWQTVAGPEVLPVLRRIVTEPPPHPHRENAMLRDAAFERMFEMDPASARALILRDALDAHAEPSLKVIQLLPQEDMPAIVASALERLSRNTARELDYELIDRYAGPTALGVVQAVYESRRGKWACAPQSAMLRYFLRVDPTYGASQASASLAAREATHCYAYVLGSLGDQLPGAEQSAISALDDADPELVLDAARALERQGSAGAEGALWARLRRFRQEWTGREDQLRRTPDHEGAESRAVAVEEALVSAIAKGHGWICGSDKLARLAGLASTERQRREIDRWIGHWNQPTALIQTFWSARRDPAFSLLQYDGLTEARLRTKLAQLPRGKRLAWQFWPQHPAMVSMTVQEACYARMRAVAGKHGLTLDKAGNP